MNDELARAECTLSLLVLFLLLILYIIGSYSFMYISLSVIIILMIYFIERQKIRLRDAICGRKTPTPNAGISDTLTAHRAK